MDPVKLLLADIRLSNAEKRMAEMAETGVLSAEQLADSLMDTINSCIILGTPFPLGLEAQIRRVLLLGTKQLVP